MPSIVQSKKQQQAQLYLGACLLLALGPLYTIAQSDTFIAYPFTMGATRCYSCGNGNFSNRSGAETCMACPAGTYTQLNESTSCWPCPNKTFAPRMGMSSCLPCSTVEYQGASVCPPPPVITTFFGEYDGKRFVCSLFHV